MVSNPFVTRKCCCSHIIPLGVYLVLFFASTYFLITGPGSRKDARFYVVYGVLLLIFVTFAHAEHAVFGQLMWIEHRDVVGGPAAFLAENISDWHNTLGSAASVAANSFGDALLVSDHLF